MTLSNHFNQNAAKQQQIIKTEDDMRTGVRKDSYGNSKYVRGGKIQRIVWADGSRDSHGAEVKHSKLHQRAVEAKHVSRAMRSRYDLSRRRYCRSSRWPRCLRVYRKQDQGADGECSCQMSGHRTQ
jgi:hypothetical protein